MHTNQTVDFVKQKVSEKEKVTKHMIKNLDEKEISWLLWTETSIIFMDVI